MGSDALLLLVASIDIEWDLTVPHLVISGLGALVSLWVMMCMTRHARFWHAAGRWAYGLRVCLGITSVIFASRFAQTLFDDGRTYALDVALEAIVVGVLLTLPLALREQETPSR